MFIRRAIGAALLLAVFTVMVGAGTMQGGGPTPPKPPSTVPDPKALRVELDIFSGRPNPTWELNAEVTAEFLKRYGALPANDSKRTIADGLGYRGLIVTAKDGRVDGYDDIVLSKGIVLGRQGRSSSAMIDKDRALERWLLNTGKSHVDPAIFKEAMNGL